MEYNILSVHFTLSIQDLESHQTLLSYAAQEGYVEPCRLLLLAGADPNILDGVRLKYSLSTLLRYYNAVN